MRDVQPPSPSAAALLGLLASTFSIVVLSLGAGRFGRDIGMDLMLRASLLFRDAAWDTRADITVIAVGILVHLAAHVGWALVFFVGLGRWTTRLGPGRLLLVAPPYALVTSALEWLVLMPLLFGHVVFTLEKSYWLGAIAHLASASLYPLYPALRDVLDGRRSSPARRFGAAYGGAALGLVAVLTVAAALGREVPHIGGDISWDRDFMRRMGAHHEQGLEMAELAHANANDPYLRALARLMSASQRGEIRTLERWWRSWFETPPALVCTEAERAVMPGMLSRTGMAALQQLRGRAFDDAFVEAMSHHHRGAVAMADEALARASDPRLMLFSHAIRHEQRGEILLMQRVDGLAAVRLALRALHAPFGAHPADTPDGAPRAPAATPPRSGTRS